MFYLQINLIAPPLYVVTTTTLERELGVETLKKAIEAIEKAINESNGQFSVKMEVRICQAISFLQYSYMYQWTTHICFVYCGVITAVQNVRIAYNLPDHMQWSATQQMNVRKWSYGHSCSHALIGVACTCARNARTY